MAYIKQETVISELKNLPEQERIEYMGIYDCIKSVPAADVVEVVRCKDCRFWDAVKNPKHRGTGICEPPNPSLGGYCTRRGATKESDYCSFGVRGKSKYGERKDGEK